MRTGEKILSHATAQPDRAKLLTLSQQSLVAATGGECGFDLFGIGGKGKGRELHHSGRIGGEDRIQAMHFLSGDNTLASASGGVVSLWKGTN